MFSKPFNLVIELKYAWLSRREFDQAHPDLKIIRETPLILSALDLWRYQRLRSVR